MDGFAKAVADSMTTLVFFGAIVAALFLVLRYRMKERERLYDLVRHAQDKGQPLSADVVRQMTRGDPPSRQRDIRRGVFYLAIACGLGLAVVLTYAFTTDAHTRNDVLILLGPAGALGCAGGAFLLLGTTQWRSGGRSDERSDDG
jgi:hypothetical protein